VTDGESEGGDCDEVICAAQDEVNQEDSEALNHHFVTRTVQNFSCRSDHAWMHDKPNQEDKQLDCGFSKYRAVASVSAGSINSIVSARR